jgi:16S rRNA (uracil1498-N3)-methyltransferase
VLDRFYCPSLSDAMVELTVEEFHHLAHVLRKRVGDRVALFDGRGGWAEGTVESLGKREGRVRVDRVQPPSAEIVPAVCIATAVPKGDRSRWLVEKLTELNVETWTPLQTVRSVVDPGVGRLEKLQQTVIAACKQCGRNRLLRVAPLVTWQDWLAHEQVQSGIFVADPGGEPISAAFERLTLRTAPLPRLAAAVGPEGGFAPEELKLAREAGAVCVSLGTPILRIETAAVALAAFLRLR